jgi:hypothetical protein
MNLHLDRDSFEAILLEVEQNTGVRADILEKDYYVTLMLKELSDKQDELNAYFKGGTALYKALRSIRRFSEDIDLTVAIDDCPSRTQADKRLKNAAKNYTVLERIEGEGEEKKGSITAVFKYDSVVSVDAMDMLQRFERVKVEATSFTVSEPTEIIEISPKLFDLADIQRQEILSSTFNVKPFGIKTIKLERIFVDKVFASEFYYTRKMQFDTAKHIYNIAVLFDNQRIKQMLKQRDYLEKMVSFKRLEEKERLGGVPENVALKDFTYFDALPVDREFTEEFNRMQNIYVFDSKDNITFENLMDIIGKLKKILKEYEL